MTEMLFGGAAGSAVLRERTSERPSSDVIGVPRPLSARGLAGPSPTSNRHMLADEALSMPSVVYFLDFRDAACFRSRRLSKLFSFGFRWRPELVS